jgi:deazaflavin-dependent oxidoreductase (nitroreductase family)
MRFLRPFTTKYFNPISRHFVHRLPGFGIISYRGRKSGSTIRTPMNYFRDGEAYVFALTYGPEVQWVKNVLASGEAELQIGRRHVQLKDPVLFVDPTRRKTPVHVRIFLGLMRVTCFLRMSPTEPTVARSRHVSGAPDQPVG